MWRFPDVREVGNCCLVKNMRRAGPQMINDGTGNQNHIRFQTYLVHGNKSVLHKANIADTAEHNYINSLLLSSQFPKSFQGVETAFFFVFFWAGSVRRSGFYRKLWSTMAWQGQQAQAIVCPLWIKEICNCFFERIVLSKWWEALLDCRAFSGRQTCIWSVFPPLCQSTAVLCCSAPLNFWQQRQR